jgi:tetratricopeptide (TPR) repeat protein
MPLPSDGGHRADLAWLLPLAAVVRIVYLIQLSATPLARHLLVDEQGYHLWARSVAAGELLRPEPFYQAPLYPYLLGGWYALFGEGHHAVRVLHACLGLISVALLYLIGRKVFGRSAGRLAGLGAALYLPFLFYEGQVLKASLALLATLVLVWLLLRAAGSGRGMPWLHAGLGLGTLALLRGNALLYLPFLFVWHLARKPDEGHRARPWSRRSRDLGLLLAGTLLAVSPATLHNLAAGGEWILTTYQGGTNFYIGNHHGALGVYMPIRQGRETPAFEGEDATLEASERSGGQLSPAEVSRFWFREGLRFARQHPGEFLRLQGVKLLLSWNAREVPDVWDVQFVARLVPTLRWWLPTFGWMAPLGLLGLGLAYPWSRDAGVLALLTLATTLSVSPFYVFARYRLPLAPLVLLFGGYALHRGIAAVRRRRWKRLGAGAAALLPLFFVVHLPLSWFGLVFTDEVGHQNLGFLQLEEGESALAEEEFTRAVAINPDLTNAWLALAQLQWERGDHEAAQRSLQELLQHVDRRRTQDVLVIDPVAEGTARLRLGRLRRNSQRPEQAIRQFRLAADLQPRQTTPLIELGITLRTMGRWQEARAAYLEALQRGPEDPLALYNLANVELEAGDTHAAVARLQSALRSCGARRPGLCDDIRARLQALQD